MAHIDPVLGTRRCGGSHALYIRFLSRFQDDQSLSSLNSAIKSGDCTQAFRHAHALKGLAAQLGLIDLSAKAAALCDMLRPLPDPIPQQAYALLLDLSHSYCETLEAIDRFRNISSS